MIDLQDRLHHRLYPVHIQLHTPCLCKCTCLYVPHAPCKTIQHDSTQGLLSSRPNARQTCSCQPGTQPQKHSELLRSFLPILLCSKAASSRPCEAGAALWLYHASLMIALNDSFSARACSELQCCLEMHQLRFLPPGVASPTQAVPVTTASSVQLVHGWQFASVDWPDHDIFRSWQARLTPPMWRPLRWNVRRPLRRNVPLQQNVRRPLRWLVRATASGTDRIVCSTSGIRAACFVRALGLLAVKLETLEPPGQSATPFP